MKLHKSHFFDDRHGTTSIYIAHNCAFCLNSNRSLKCDYDSDHFRKTRGKSVISKCARKLKGDEKKIHLILIVIVIFEAI